MTKSKIKYHNRKSKLMMSFMSFQMNIVFHPVYTFHHSNEITTFVRRHKERNKQNGSTKFEISFFSKFLALKFCSTSSPGGNQVDGLPPVVKFTTDWVGVNRYFVHILSIVWLQFCE